MDESFPDVLMPLVAAHHSGEKLVFLFDYDGTLTPIVEHPWQAKLSPRVRQLLGELAALPHTRVGVLSSRRIEEVEQLVGLPSLYYSGLSGIEIKLEDTTLVHPLGQQGAPLIDEVARRLGAIEQVYPGAWVEHKRYGLTVHYRGVAAEHVDEAHARILDFLGCWSDRLRLVEAPRAVEATLAGTWTKGDAVNKIVAHVGEPAFVFYAGDAPNDREAFDAVTALGGISVGVGPLAPPSAAAHVETPDALMNWVQGLRHALQAAPVEL